MPFTITRVWAYIATDAEGTEGVCAFQTIEGFFLMMSATEESVESMRPIAISSAMGRTDIEEILPT